MDWFKLLFDGAERVRASARAAYRQNRHRITNDPTLPAMFRQFMAQGMSAHEMALAITLGAFYVQFRKHPVTDRAVLCEVAPLFFVEPEEEAVSTLAEYCVYLTNEKRADRDLLIERLSVAVHDSQYVPFTEPIHWEYQEWVARAVEAGSPWLVLLRPAALQAVADRKSETDKPSEPDDGSGNHF